MQISFVKAARRMSAGLYVLLACFFTLRLLFHARRWKFVLNSCLMLAYVRIINFLLILLLIIIIICQATPHQTYMSFDLMLNS